MAAPIGDGAAACLGLLFIATEARRRRAVRAGELRSPITRYDRARRLRKRSMAVGMPEGSGPPAWAKSGRPPPEPPTQPATSR